MHTEQQRTVRLRRFLGLLPTALRRSSARLTLGFLLLALAAAPAHAWRGVGSASGAGVRVPNGRTFYVSTSGSDRATGRSERHPWRTVARVNRERLAPGDRVLFRGGDTFAGVGLMPTTSGVAGSPIVYGSYGRAHATIAAHDGAVFLPEGRSHLVFEHLQLTTGDSSRSSIVSSSNAGPGSVDIRVVSCALYGTGGAAILSKQPRDADWRLVGNRIGHIGDSGIIVFGSNPLIASNRIDAVGWNDELPWAKHGIYVKAANAVVRGNQIHGFPSDGISLRYPNAVVTDNVISGGAIGIAYFSYNPVAGHSLVKKNTIVGVSTAGFYYDPFTYAGGDFPRESFKLVDNVVRTSGVGFSVEGARHSTIQMVDNRLQPGYSLAFAAGSVTGGSYTENGNRLGGAALVRWNGADISLAEYRAASGQGANDAATGAG